MALLNAALSRRVQFPIARVASRWVPVGVYVASVALFLTFNDRGEGGDYQRILFDIRNRVVLLKAEPLTPAIFLLVSRIAWFLRTHVGVFRRLELVPALQFAVSLISGLGVVALLRIARRLAAKYDTSPWPLFGAFLSTGAVALFFGHIEAYTIPCVAMLWYFAVALEFLESGRRFWLACLLLGLASTIHMEMLVLFPSLLYLAWVGRQRDGWWALRSHFISIALLTGLPVVIIQRVALLFPPPYPQYFGGGDATMFVPLFAPPGRPDAITLLSVTHLLNTSNIYLLAGPAAAVLVLLAIAIVRTALLKDQRFLFLLLALAGWFALTQGWNVDNGAWGDWDLFIGIGFPLTILGGYVAVRWMPAPYSSAALVVLAATQWSLVIPFVAYNHFVR